MILGADVLVVVAEADLAAVVVGVATSVAFVRGSKDAVEAAIVSTGSVYSVESEFGELVESVVKVSDFLHPVIVNISRNSIIKVITFFIVSPINQLICLAFNQSIE